MVVVVAVLLGVDLTVARGDRSLSVLRPNQLQRFLPESNRHCLHLLHLLRLHFDEVEGDERL